MEQESQTKPETPVSEDTYHRFDQLVRVAYSCRVFSWVVLVLSMVTPLANFFGRLGTFSGIPLEVIWGNLIQLFATGLASGLYRFVVLQALAQLLYLLLDIEYNTRSTSAAEVSHE